MVFVANYQSSTLPPCPPPLILRCKLCFSGGYAIGFPCRRICKLPNLLEVGRYPDIVRQPEKVSGPWIHKHLFSRFIRKRIKKVYQYISIIVSRYILIWMSLIEVMRCYQHQWTIQWPTSAWPWAWYKRADPSTFCKITKVSTPHESTFCHISSPQKMLPHCRHANDAARASLFHVAGWQQLFFLSTYPAAFTTFTPCFRHRSRAIATYSSQDNHQPHRFEQKQRQRQKFKATALADVTSFKVPTKDWANSCSVISSDTGKKNTHHKGAPWIPGHFNDFQNLLWFVAQPNRQATYLSDFIQSFTYLFMLVSTHISNVEDLVFHLRAAPVGLWLVSVEIGHNPRFVACRRFASQFDHLPMKICKNIPNLHPKFLMSTGVVS